DTLSLNKVYSSSVTTPTCRRQVTSPQGEALETADQPNANTTEGVAMKTPSVSHMLASSPTCVGAHLKDCQNRSDFGEDFRFKQDAPPEFLKKIAGGAVSSLTEGVLTNSADQPYPIPETWQWVKLGKIGILERGRSKHRPRNDPKLFGGVYPFIQTGDISNAGMYIYEHKQTLSEIGLQQSKLFSKGTLCITIAANIGKVSILTYDCCFPDSVVGFTPNDNTSSEYIYYMMDNIQKELESSAPATAQKNFNLKRLNDVAIPLPPLPEQKEIVRILDTLLAKSDKAKELAENALENIETLKKTILAKAFRGLLGTNRPDEASSLELLKQSL
ncbi:MAG: restriction endonuclease subunit S, partial [Candidatus Riflebacteria bacterium]|nr:restriction endonuclease subunit S [Candidatus Riflebacteria bacterium]